MPFWRFSDVGIYNKYTELTNLRIYLPYENVQIWHYVFILHQTYMKCDDACLLALELKLMSSVMSNQQNIAIFHCSNSCKTKPFFFSNMVVTVSNCNQALSLCTIGIRITTGMSEIWNIFHEFLLERVLSAILLSLLQRVQIFRFTSMHSSSFLMLF